MHLKMKVECLTGFGFLVWSPLVFLSVIILKGFEKP